MTTRFRRTGVYGFAITGALAAMLGLRLQLSPEDDQEAPAQAKEQPKPPPPPITLTLRTDKVTYCQVEPIVLECEITNHSIDQGFSFPNYWNHGFNAAGREALYFEVTQQGKRVYREVTQQGKRVSYTRRGPTGAGASNKKTLKPGETLVWRYLINASFDMTLDGEYVLAGSIPIRGPYPYGDSEPAERPKIVYDGYVVEAEPIRVTVEDCPLVQRQRPRSPAAPPPTPRGTNRLGNRGAPPSPTASDR